MYSAFDIANYFLIMSDDDADELLSNLKLQKLLYYAQGAHLALKGVPLFSEKIYAWIHGPAVAEVYYNYQNYKNQGIPAPGTPPDIDSETQEVLDEVSKVYGQFSAWKLCELTHEEPPWKETFKGEEITYQKLKEYFDTQVNDG